MPSAYSFLKLAILNVSVSLALMVLEKCVQVSFRLFNSNKCITIIAFVDVCDGYCENEGNCVKDVRGQPSCRCIGSFTGKHCQEKSEFAYIAGGIAASVILIIFIVLLIWMICAR